MHAFNGNRPPKEAVGGWQTPTTRAAEGRALQEPQAVGRLRAQGWKVPDSIGDEYQLRVYDTRLERRWLLNVAEETSGVNANATLLVGGDFLTAPHLEDAEALRPELRRWGPDGSTAVHLVVPPRAHQAVWATRCALQMRVEDPATVCTMCVLVPREQCTAIKDGPSLRRQLPQLQSLFDDSALAIRIFIVGERAPVQRVPAHTEAKTLPPIDWERAQTPVNRALLLVQVRRANGGPVPPQIGAVRGALPAPRPSDVELLRLEYVLPPGLKQQTAERAARRALQLVAKALHLPEPPPHQLRQVQVVHGAVVALLGVPRPQACDWLRGSGCGGLYLRPFWTEHTGRDLDRTKFTLLWARGQGERGPLLWDVFHNKLGVYGLLASGKDVAVRVSAEADVAALQAQLCATLDDVKATFRRPIPGQRWWRLGPLTEAEVWQAADLVTKTGLVAIGALRVAAAGPFRKYVYFAAAGRPTCTSLDDGSWTGSSAQLQPADPPPRKKATSGAALPPQSTWAGPRLTPTGPAEPAQAASALHSGWPNQPLATAPSVWLPNQPTRQTNIPLPPGPSVTAPALTAFPAMPPPATARQSKGRNRGRAPPAVVSTLPPAPSQSPANVAPGPLEVQLTLMNSQMAAMMQELRELRKENDALRRQVELFRGLQQHQPYAPVVPQLLPAAVSASSPVRPQPVDRHRLATDLTPPGRSDPDGAVGDVSMQSPPMDVESKRVRRALDLLPLAAAPDSSGSSGADPGHLALVALPPDDA